MEKEIKIIIRCIPESMDNDKERLESIVYVGDKAIGCLQSLDLHIDTKSTKLSVTFPDLANLDYDKSAYQNSWGMEDIPFTKEVESYIANLPHYVEINKTNIDDGSSVLALEEIGTNGFIDSIPMRRRYGV